MLKEVVFVPHWIANTLRRKKLSLSAILDYQKARQLFSLDDCAALLAVQEGNDIVPFSNAHWFGHLLSSWNKSATSAQVLELDSTVRPLSHSDDVRGEILSRLEEVDEYQETQSLFELIDVERACVFVVMNPGFVKGLQSSETKLDFMRKILKVFYVHCSVQEVSRTEMFSDYVAMLEKSVWG